MNTTTRKEIKLKDGTVIPASTPITIRFKGNGSCYAVITTPTRDFITHARNLPSFAKGISKCPSMAELERQSNDGICDSVLGERVEPDGWDCHGSPSWLLVLGVI